MPASRAARTSTSGPTRTRPRRPIAIARLRGDRGELPPAIDVETDGGLRPTALAVKVRVWVNRVRDQLGVEPIDDASPDFWRDSVGGADIPQPLWLAHYTTKCPTVPQPATRWTFWQFSQSGRVPRGSPGRSTSIPR